MKENNKITTATKKLVTEKSRGKQSKHATQSVKRYNPVHQLAVCMCVCVMWYKIELETTLNWPIQVKHIKDWFRKNYLRFRCSEPRILATFIVVVAVVIVAIITIWTKKRNNKIITNKRTTKKESVAMTLDDHAGGERERSSASLWNERSIEKKKKKTEQTVINNNK